MSKVIFEKEYNWESSFDFERDLTEALEELQDKEGDEWQGTIKVTIEYEPNN